MAILQHDSAQLSANSVHKLPTCRIYFNRRKHQDRRKDHGSPFETTRPYGNHEDISLNTLARAATRRFSETGDASRV